jgi:DUF917 family protein
MKTKKAVKKHGGDVYVSPHPKGGWQVKKAGASKAYKRLKSQKEAIAIGRAMAQKAASELVVQRGDDGRIRLKDSHGHDPRRSKG